MEKEIGLKKGIVKVEKYNPRWQEEFRKEQENLKKIFGNVAKSIEHVGSTSIVGLCAKPIIDIAVGVDALEDINEVKEKILKLPHYSVKEDNADGEILMRKGSPVREGETKPDFITHFIHIMEINGRKYRETLTFRDYLRANPEVLKEYEKLKQKLAIEYQNDRKTYFRAKDKFIKSILSKCDSSNFSNC
ncbi:MAG TPA: GrpB family protein [bacterium]|nr:GrpB family protein [bacterium]